MIAEQPTQLRSLEDYCAFLAHEIREVHIDEEDALAILFVAGVASPGENIAEAGRLISREDLSSTAAKYK